MKIIMEPTVTVVGYSKFVEHPKYKIPPDGSDAVKIGAFAAKGCYDSYGEHGRANTANQEAVRESRHGSVLEHSTVSLFIEGITRGCSLELNRHRPISISQRSTRYTKEEDSEIVLDPYYAALFRKHNFKFHPDKKTIIGTYDPQYIEEYKLIRTHFENFIQCVEQYKYEVETLINLNPNKLTGFDLRKWARGKARNSLPHGLETRGTWTSNHRGWRWFVELRSERHAEPEIRRLANHIFEAVKTVAPECYEDFENNGVYDGIIEWKPRHSKI